MSLVPPATLFGVPLRLHSSASSLVELLDEVWITNYARSPRSLDEDMKALKAFFDPVATGRRLRELIERIGPVSVSLDVPFDTSSLLLRVDERRYLLRPEGRLVLEAIQKIVPSGAETVTIPVDTVLACSYAAARVYADWGTHRLGSVIENLGGLKPLQAQPMGMLLWLLVNRCTSEARGVPTRLVDDHFRDRVDGVLEGPVQAFAEVVARGGKQERQRLSLYSGWQVTEAKRRLGSKLNLGENVYIVDGQEDAVIRTLAQDLAKRGTALSKVEEAFQKFLGVFEGSAKTLAALGLYHATSAETTRIRKTLLERLSECASE